MYLLAALAAAVLFAVSTVLKHRTAREVDARLSPDSGLRQLVRLTVRHRIWLIGLGVDAGGLALQVVALHLGPLVAVQPLLSSSVVVALLVDRHHVSRRSWAWALLLVAGLSAFVALVGTGSGAARPDHTAALAAVLVVGSMVTGGLLLGRRLPHGRATAIVLSVGVGTSYAASAALIKVITDHYVATGVASVFVSWQLYAVLACGAAGVLLNQLAFSAGPLHHSLPTISAVDPVASVLLGAAVFDERMRMGSAAGVVEVLALVAVVVAITGIGRTDRHRAVAA